MAQFLTTTQTLGAIQDTITRATKSVTLITPFVQISGDFERRLDLANSKGVQIHFVCRCSDLKEDQQAILARFENLRLYDEPLLHAKCFFNEAGLVLTSLNLYEYSERNHEMGVLLDARSDGDAYARAVDEANLIRKHARLVKLGMKPSRKQGRSPVPIPSTKKKDSMPEVGYCIRCGIEIAYDPAKPYCYDHYKEWSKWSDPEYGDNLCHSCGKEEWKGFSLNYPECKACYRSNSSRRATA